ncbi:MAG TPA: N,N-dimethylformamidase beta subunit family domain-containing protein, partial [Thermoanaerobaculia bacterium]|nr:N,N-dimethylformamidase beta subunit family domain-containing protein [Thermoanaerobaculia bacterium]
RPYEQADGLGRFESWERRFVDWMRDTNRAFEVVTDQDLHDPTLLANYNVVVLVGHSAYWTAAARQNLETFSNNGGHVAILGGNTMWFRVAHEDNGRTLVGENDAQAEIGSEPSGIVTANWYRHPVNQPENRLVATSFRHGGVANRSSNLQKYEMVPIEQRSPWTVTDASHWVFSGTGLTRGTTFGRETTGLEVDGVVFNCDISGVPARPDGSDDAPMNYHILAVTPASLGWGTMGYYVNPAGGAVFNAASQGWVWGLEFNETIQRITANVLDRFASGARLPYDPAQTAIVAEDLFNCPPTLIAQPGWRTAGARGAVTPGCAYEGPGGLELSGPNQIGLARSIARAGESRSHVELRFYVKADDLQRRTDVPRPVVTLQHRTPDGVRQVAHVELDVNGNTRQVRLSRRNPDGGFAATTDWVTLPDGWHLIEATWRSPGTMALQVDGGTILTLENPNSGQTANEMVIEFPAAQLTEAGRLCIDAIAAGTEKPGRVAQQR